MYPAPRIEPEPDDAPRLEAASMLPAAPVGRGPGTLALTLAGLAVLVVGFAALWAVAGIAALFDRSAGLGWAGVAVAVVGFGLVFWALARELRGLFALGRVDALRTAFAAGDAARAHRAARAWLAQLPDGAALRPAIDAAGDTAAILALLRVGPSIRLRSAADALARNAAVQAAALAAATPSPALDGVVIAWRGVRLVRQVASLYGLRPGLLGTLALLRRTALAAATVAGGAFVANTAAHALLSNPLLERLLGDMAGAGIAARRMVVLARATALACDPLPPR